MCSNNLKLPIRAAPYKHQRDAAVFALDRLVDGGGAALLMEMGTGKTLTTIAAGPPLRELGTDLGPIGLPGSLTCDLGGRGAGFGDDHDRRGALAVPPR